MSQTHIHKYLLLCRLDENNLWYEIKNKNRCATKRYEFHNISYKQ